MSTQKNSDLSTSVGEMPKRIPLDAFGPVVSRFSRELADQVQAPVEIAAMACLGVMSTAVLGKVQVRLKSTWVEHLGVWSVVVAGSGERKSAVMKPVTKPLRAYEERRREAEEAAYLKKKMLHEAADKRASELKRRYASAKDENELAAIQNEMEDFAKVLAATPEPHRYRLLVDDITPEALFKLLSIHPALGMVSDEAGPLEGLTRTAGGENRKQLEIYLKASDGSAHSTDRIGRTSDRSSEPLVTYMLTVQPGVAVETLADKRLNDRGLIARFLWCQPRSMVGSRLETIEEREILTPDAVAGWYELVERLATLPMPSADERPVLTLSPSAWALLVEHINSIEPLLIAGGSLSERKEWANRDAARVAKIAAILHVAEAGVKDTQIPLSRLERALQIGYWSRREALSIFGAADSVTPTTKAEDKVVRCLQRIVDDSEIVEGQGLDIHFSDVWRRVKGGTVPDIDRLSYILNELSLEGHLQVVEVDRGRRVVELLPAFVQALRADVPASPREVGEA